MTAEEEALRRELEATKDELLDAIALLENAGIAFDKIRTNNRLKGHLVTNLARSRDKARDDRLKFEHRAYAAEVKVNDLQREIVAMTKERNVAVDQYKVLMSKLNKGKVY